MEGSRKQWTRALDTLAAVAMAHKDIARYLKDEEDVPPCWTQTITDGDERIRCLGDTGQHRSGIYDGNKSKTFNLPITKLFAAFAARQCKRWLGDVALIMKKAAWGDR